MNDRALERLNTAVKLLINQQTFTETIERLSDELQDAQEPFVWSVIDPRLISGGLPEGIKSCWVFVLRKDVPSGCHYHPNSVQHMVTLKGQGSSKVAGINKRMARFGSPADSLADLWYVIGKGVHHEFFPEGEDMVVVSFHTCAADELEEVACETGERRIYEVSTVKVLDTERLILRRLSPVDAKFILQLLNEPSWLRYIGDKGVRTIEDARDYILKGPLDMYARLGFGLYLVQLKDEGTPIGICGLIKRETLEEVDIGFAFLPQFWGKGYAFESASATMAYGKRAFGLTRLAAITSLDNLASAALLEKLGFRFERVVKLSSDSEGVRLFTIDL